MTEQLIAIGGAFIGGLLLGWLFTRGGGSAQAAGSGAAASAAPAAGGIADERRAARLELASLRRRLAAVESALREIRRRG